MTRTVERFTAENDEASGRYRLDCNLVAGGEDQKSARLESLAMNVDVPLQEINPAFVMIVIEQERRSGIERRIGIKQLRERGTTIVSSALHAGAIFVWGSSAGSQLIGISLRRQIS